MVGVVEGALLAAEDDQAVVAGMALGDGIAEMSAGGGRSSAPASRQRLADQAGRRSDEILDDEDAHGDSGSQLGASLADLVAWRATGTSGRGRAACGSAKQGPRRGMRLYAIGDMHGCDDLLAEAHAQDRRRPCAPAGRRLPHHPYRRLRRPRAGLGRGGRAAGIRLKADDPRVICLRGNHEEFLLAFLRAPERVGEVWLINGAAETLASYGVFVGDYADLTSLGEALPRGCRAITAASSRA